MGNAPLDPYDCGCGWLEQAAADSSVPIDFDPQTNEYYVKVKMGEIEGQMFIKFCPNCGGDAPVSTRDKFFSVVSMEDRNRLFEFASKYRTKAEVLTAWGQPDENHPGGYGISNPEKEGHAGAMVFLDLMRYNNILPTAIIEVIVRPDDRVNISYSVRPK